MLLLTSLTTATMSQVVVHASARAMGPVAMGCFNLPNEDRCGPCLLFSTLQKTRDSLSLIQNHNVHFPVDRSTHPQYLIRKHAQQSHRRRWLQRERWHFFGSSAYFSSTVRWHLVYGPWRKRWPVPKRGVTKEASSRKPIPGLTRRFTRSIQRRTIGHSFDATACTCFAPPSHHL